MNVLEMVRSVCGKIGLSQPGSLIGTTDIQTIQLRELLNKEGSELAARSATGWQALIREATFATVAQEDQGRLQGLRFDAEPGLGSILEAVNAYRHVVSETIWNRTTRQPIYGPRGPGTWQGLKAFTVVGPYPEYRIRGGNLLFLPAPASGDTCAFEYVTKNWLASEDGTEQRSIVEDDEDEPLLDDEIMMMGLEWRWRAAKGLDFGQSFQDYERRVVDALARDGTKPTRQLSSDSNLDRIPVAIPRLIGS